MTKTLEQRIRIIEDREEIVRLKARYCNCNDGGWNGIPSHHDVEAVVNMFVPDGTWDAGQGGRANGHAQIRELFTRFGAIPFIIHNVMNPIIEIDGDVAHGDWHAIITNTSPPNLQANWIFGKYEEDYVRTPEGWKFKHPRFSIAAHAPYELGWGKAQFGRSQTAEIAH